MRRPLAARLSGLAVPLGAAAALLLSIGPAHASSGYGQLIVNPGTVAPGQSVSILGTCPNNGHGLGGVYSSAFVGGSASLTQTSINFSGSATIASNASGSYQVTADCGPGSPNAVTITVAGSVVAPPTSHAPSSPAQTSASAMPPVATSKAAMGGGMNPATTKPATPTASGAMAMGGGAPQAMSPTPGMTAAGNGPVTSTGIVRVGLAGSSRSALTTAGAAAIAVALALAGGVGFLVIRRRRNTPGTHI
ncbi:MAG TPA: hypothetical protein VFU65_16260 [Actinocrinis sp.]|nr:hypothetical protein [Actinocrinis sp.]